MENAYELIGCKLATHTINFLEPIFAKYYELSNLLNIEIEEALPKGMAAVLLKNDFLFHKIFEDIKFDYDLTIYEFKTEYSKIAEILFAKTAIDYTFDHLIVDEKEHPHDEYSEFFPFQNNLIEYVALAYLRKQIYSGIKEIVVSKWRQNEFLTMEEAAQWTGLTFNEIKKLQKLDELRLFNAEVHNEKVFRRKDVERLIVYKKCFDFQKIL